MSETKPVFTVEQIKSTMKPYEYLWELKKKNRVLFAQEVVRIETLAKSLKAFNDFRRIWRAYQDDMKPSDSADNRQMDYTLPSRQYVLDCGSYVCNDSGVSTWDTQRGIVKVCSHPIMPTKRIINLDSGDCKTEIAFRRGPRWRSIIVEKGVLASAQKIVGLATNDIDVTSENAKQLVTFLATVETLNYGKLPEVQSIGRLGWVHDDAFAPYVDNVMFDGGEQFRHAFEAVKEAGSLDKWKDCISEIRRGDSVAARIMLAASFSSVLIQKLNALPYIVHCWSSVSGIGKTVALMAAGSVWANPRQGEYLKTYNTTSVGIEMLAGFHGDLPLCMDELQLKGDRRDAFENMIYSYCEGVGRTRGSRNGGLQKTMSWHNCLISTGEEPLTSGSSKAGAVNRVLDIGAGDVQMFKDPRGTVSVLTQNYGTAGHVFIDSLKEGAIEQIKDSQDQFFQQLEGRTTDKQRLAASIILAADAWATQVIFQDGRALTADDIVPFLQSEAATNVNLRAYEWLMGVIGVNSTRFSGQDSNERWGLIDKENNQAYIIKSKFDELMQAEGYNSVGFLQWAKKQGLLTYDITKNDPRLTKKKRLPGIEGAQNCVCIRMLDDVPDNVDHKTGYMIVDEQTDVFNMV